MPGNHPFIEYGLHPGYSTGRVIYWKLDPFFKDELPYNFTIQSSEDPKFSEVHTSIPVGDNFYGVDSTNTVQAIPQSYIYRVKLETGSGVYYSPNFFIDKIKGEMRKYLYAAEIVRKELLRIRQYTGSGVSYLLKRKNYAKISEEDVDPISGVVLTDNKNSFGTGFQGGYYPPLKVMFSREDSKDQMQLSQGGDGITQEKTLTARFVGFPLISTRDVLALSNGERYNLVESGQSYYPGTNIIVIQQCQAKLIPPTDPVYSIEVPHE